MTSCVFATDLHGSVERYEKLWRAVERERPRGVLLGGDLLPPPPGRPDFVDGFLVSGFERVRQRLGSDYPLVLLILGNDDPRCEEPAFLDVAARGLWSYAHERWHTLGAHRVFGYAYVPPSPFLLKDWERYDVSRYVPPGCVSPEEGRRSVPVSEHDARYSTIRRDLERLAGDGPLDDAVFLFHAPPHATKLDRAALDGRTIDHVPLDVHVGSIAVRRFIESRQPLVTLHGHVHESARLTGAWSDRIGGTLLYGAAHDGPELALVSIDLDDPGNARRRLL